MFGPVRPGGSLDSITRTNSFSKLEVGVAPERDRDRVAQPAVRFRAAWQGLVEYVQKRLVQSRGRACGSGRERFESRDNPITLPRDRQEVSVMTDIAEPRETRWTGGMHTAPQADDMPTIDARTVGSRRLWLRLIS
jgi:hypothetical protein